LLQHKRQQNHSGYEHPETTMPWAMHLGVQACEYKSEYKTAM